MGHFADQVHYKVSVLAVVAESNHQNDFDDVRDLLKTVLLSFGVQRVLTDKVFK